MSLPLSESSSSHQGWQALGHNCEALRQQAPLDLALICRCAASASSSGRGRVDLRGRPVGVGEGGCFPGNDIGCPGLASDPTRPPTRPRPTRPGPQLHILSPIACPPSEPPPASDPTSHWRVQTRRGEPFHILETCEATSSSTHTMMAPLELIALNCLRSSIILSAG